MNQSFNNPCNTLNKRYIGIMSGTSLDAVDAVVVDIQNQTCHTIAHHQITISDTLRQSILDLCQPGPDEIRKMAKVDNQLATLYTYAVDQLLSKAQLDPREITAIGLHGQTIRHLPELSNSIQIGNPSQVAYNSGITTVADFRRKDMAAKGQGAPLVPAFHRLIFNPDQENHIVVNIGGIANITCLPADPSLPISGFDTGPGNLLLDAWIKHINGHAYDDKGQWAASGHLNQQLLESLIAHPYFQLTPPKSTGRESFHLDWLRGIVSNLTQPPTDQDVQHTLAHLTAHSIRMGIEHTGIGSAKVIICGGGAKNQFLIRLLQDILGTQFIVTTAEELGVDSQHVEAMMMAWLAKQRIEHKPTQLVDTTGAERNVILGCVYLAN